MGRPSLRKDVVCPQCGDGFSAQRAELARGKGKFCSKSCATGSRHKEPSSRIMDYVVIDPETGCWVWIGCKNNKGYGWFKTPQHKKSRLAHRISFEIFNGPIPENFSVCHSCDRPSCVNPAHLFVGDHKTNMADMLEKGRNSVIGKKTPDALITKIVGLLSSGETQKEIAAVTGVSRYTVMRIAKENGMGRRARN